MAATATVKEANGAGPTLSTITNARFCTADAYDDGTSNPIVIPSAGFNYSYWKHICLEMTGTFTSIENFYLYSDGSFGTWTWGTSGEMRVGARDSGDFGCPSGSYDQASGTPGTTGDDLETGHTYYSGQTNKSDPITDYTSGSKCQIDTTTSITVSGNSCYYAVLQVKVDTVANGASPGQQDSETLTWTYDET